MYRPLLFAGLAVENAIFKRDFRAWNAANLAVHLFVAYLLFEVLWRLRRTGLACGVALWFALLASNFELVTWNHLGGYMLGYGLLLLALFAAREALAENAGRPRAGSDLCGALCPPCFAVRAVVLGESPRRRSRLGDGASGGRAGVAVELGSAHSAPPGGPTGLFGLATLAMDAGRGRTNGRGSRGRRIVGRRVA